MTGLTTGSGMGDGSCGHQTSSQTSQLGCLKNGPNRATLGSDADPAVIRLVTSGEGSTTGSRVGDKTIG